VFCRGGSPAIPFTRRGPARRHGEPGRFVQSLNGISSRILLVERAHPSKETWRAGRFSGLHRGSGWRDEARGYRADDG
jgi:hypothetical protein